MGIYLYDVGGATYVTESGDDTIRDAVNDADIFNYTVDVAGGETVTFTGDFGDDDLASDGRLFAEAAAPGFGTLVVNADGTFTYSTTRSEIDSNGGNQTISFQISGLDLLGEPDTDTVNLIITCFARGTGIATPQGDRAVEALAIGDLVRTPDGRDVPVKWIGRQSLIPGALDGRADMVRIETGALGDGLPRTDLTVTADHGMIIDDLIINAGALVGAKGVTRVPAADLPARFTVYHIETQDHDVILANGAPSETFVDYVGRAVFDNATDYAARYGAERIIPEQDRPRISARRQLPHALQVRLGMIAAQDTQVRDVA